MKDNEMYLAIDIGGSKYLVGIVDRAGCIYARKKRMCKGMDISRLLQTIIADGKQLLKELRLEIHAVGITIPGLADCESGYWVESTFSGVSNIPMREIFQRAFEKQVFLDNDANACALAEKVFGHCKNKSNFIYLTVSNGIGGAIFYNGALYRGQTGNAGEFGHMIVVENGRLCQCGNHGCLEKHAAGPAIVQNYHEFGGSADVKNVEEIAALAEAGDRIAQRTFELESDYLAKTLGNAVNVLNIDCIVIGGGVSLAGKHFIPQLAEKLKKQIYRKANPDISVVATPLGYEGGLYGAAALAYKGLQKLV